MLFVLNEEASKLAEEQTAVQATRVAVSRLLNTYADGHHVVLMERSACRAIEESPNFSIEQRGAAQKIRTRYADYGSLPRLLTHYCVVTAVGTVPTRAVHGWDVPLIWLTANPVSRACLLCEDLHDTHVFLAAGADYLNEKKLGAFELHADHMGGGGGNTHRALQQAIVGRKICFCVVDSDIKGPTEGPGPTASPCTTVTGSSVFEVKLTAGRMIENSLPWRLIDRVRQNMPVVPSEDLARMEVVYPRVSEFLSLKKGVSGYDIKGMANAATKVFWTSAAAALVGTPICCPAGVCQAHAEANCSYKPHRGFGGSLLADVATWLKENDQPTRSRHYLPSPNDSDWRAIGSAVAAIFLGLQPRRL
ncbi:hypothetical protein QN397_09415 [Variovorax sp. RTB1]|uniref:hypothetical protein n=1 Tax=Variovorax sp. RTB1 TaxID=3048631 RepID=UPI002B236938|nr:hypothetical protein [Variovorax sp. RTB1]MEB0111570.1 hypothetical protein [Variovorax sp. RTB1]